MAQRTIDDKTVNRGPAPTIKPALLEAAALALLEDLSCSQWDQLNDLRSRHVTGRLSYEAWQTATAAVIHGKAGRQVRA